MISRRMLRRTLLLAATLLPAVQASGQWSADDTLSVSDLGALLDAIHESNPMLRAATDGANVLAQKPAQVRALPDPTLGLAWMPFPLFTARGSQRTQWQVQQAIPFPGKLGLREEAAEWAARAAESDATTFEYDLVLRAKYAFYDLDRTLRQETLVHEFVRTLRDFEDVASTRYKVGLGPQQSILKAQLERNALSNRLIDLSRTQRSLLSRLSALTNRPVVIQDRVPVRPDLPSMDAPPDLLAELARQHRPESAALAATFQRSEAMIELAHLERLPDFGVSVTYFDIASRDGLTAADGRNALAIGVSVRLPLQRGRLRAQLEESRLMQRQVTSRQEALETSYRTDIVDLTNQIASNREQVDLFRDALIPQASSTLSATLSAYTTGKATFLDLLDAERMLFDLRWSLEANRTSLLKAGAALERALGIRSLSEVGQ